MSYLDEEDDRLRRMAAERLALRQRADRNDPLTLRRIPVTSSHPSFCYLIAFDRASEERPTEREVEVLLSFLEYDKQRFFPHYRLRLAARVLDVNSGNNTIIFHKYGADDWGYRRATFEYGFPFAVVPPWLRDEPRYLDVGRRLGPLRLIEVMDRIRSFGDEIFAGWVAWKTEHAELFITKQLIGEDQP